METETQTQSFRSDFIKEQKIHTDTVIEEAQRLVNLYRHADSFGKDFMVRLDKMLLSAPAEVQTALSDILGGKIVRQYCAYLKERTTPKNTSDQNAENAQPLPQQGYLPDPEEQASSSQETGPDIEALFKNFLAAHKQELNELLKAQSDNLTTILGHFNQNALDVAAHQTNHLPHTIQQDSGQKKYADVIEASPQTPVLVPDETEGF